MTEHEVTTEQHERWQYRYIVDADSPQMAAQNALQSGREVERTLQDILEHEVLTVDVRVRKQIPINEARALMQEQVHEYRRAAIATLRRADLCQRIIDGPHTVSDGNLQTVDEWADDSEPGRRSLGIGTVIEFERARRLATQSQPGERASPTATGTETTDREPVR